MSGEENTEIMGLVAETANAAEHEATTPTGETGQPSANLKEEILDSVANSSAIFKSQQKEDPELTFQEKRTIAADLLSKSHSLFLARFGEHINKEHLNYFVNGEDDYEIDYHVKRLRRYLNNTSRQIDVKNRRYQALKTMVEQGQYFSETEMMRRNPLLYDHLIGQYLTEEQKKKRDNIDTTNITFVNLLLESIERDRQRSVKKAQEDAEDETLEENDSDDDSEEEDAKRKAADKVSQSHWGEMSETNDPHDKREEERRLQQARQDIPTKERQVLREEFVTHMYESFLNGKDVEFDYSTVDDNETYDNIEIRTQDEEEKYFDRESPETVLVENVQRHNDSEDELDVYMNSLKEQCPTNQLAPGNPTL